MGGLSIWHILILAVIAVLLLGRGKISEVMGDVARGVRNFREGLKDSDDKRVLPGDKPDSSDAKKDEAAKH